MRSLPPGSITGAALAAALLAAGCAAGRPSGPAPAVDAAAAAPFRVEHSPQGGTVTVFAAGRSEPVAIVQTPPEGRPYLASVAAPGVPELLRGSSSGPAPEGALLAWGVPQTAAADARAPAAVWRRASVTVPRPNGDEVRWETVYELLDGSGRTLIAETQRWAMHAADGRYLIDLEWRGDPKVDLVLGAPEGAASTAAPQPGTAAANDGLFLRLPGGAAPDVEVVNAARQRGARADGGRAMWIDAAFPLQDQPRRIHLAIFDHPANRGYPQAWRVDPAAGIGAARAAASGRRMLAGEAEIIRHRVAVYTGALDDVAITTAWSEFTGNRSTYATSALWTVAQREGRLERFLTGDQAAAAMTPLPGYTVTAWASEPMVQQPMAFCWDDRGRLWVAENLDYEARNRGFSNDGTSRIVILEDSDRDGVADRRTVFMERIVFPSALAVGFDGVFVGAPPNLLFVPDRDHDDQADIDAVEVRLTGWGIDDRHEVMNSLHWGPDGWLYGLQGFATTSRVRKPLPGRGRLYKPGEAFPDDLLEADGVAINGGVWRYHPTKDRFEIVAHGFSNPWGIDYDAKGQLVMSACVIPHLWHVVPGGIYQRQGGQHFNPYVYADIQTIADHRHRSAHGGARVYQSDAFPESQRGRVFMANIHEHAVLSDVLARSGSGFTAAHGDDFVLANNAQWIGFSLEVGPDGALYVLDWHDADICGVEVEHHETGRIFRIAATPSRARDWPGRYADLTTMSDARLVELQTSGSDWHARRARIILQGRAAAGRLDPQTHPALRRLFDDQRNPDWRLRAMWALHVTGGWTSSALREVLADRDEYVRAWAIQLLTEDGSPAREVLTVLARIAHDDPSPVVRLYLASALQRIEHDSRWQLAAPLLGHAGDAADPNLPTLLWLGIEPLVAENPRAALDQVGAGAIPQLARFAARRAVDAGALDPVVAAIERRTPMQTPLLEGLRDGLEGRVDLAPPPSWPAALRRLTRGSDPNLARLANEVAGHFGDTAAARRHLAAAADTSAPAGVRRAAIQRLALERRPELKAVLAAALDDPAVRAEAIRAIAAFDDEELGARLVERFPDLSESEKADAVQTLASRGRYGRQLTDAIAAGRIARRDVPPHAARQLRRVVGVTFADVWGPVESRGAEEQAYIRYRSLLNDTDLAGADAAHGREVFRKTCAPCHTMFGEGGTMGPDLTGSNRGNLDYLLGNVLAPNAEVQDAYRMVVVTTRDGRTHAGTVAAETERRLTLRVVSGNPVTIDKAEVQSREVTATSMMPEGLLDGLTDREVVDLVGYLRRAAPLDAASAR